MTQGTAKPPRECAYLEGADIRPPVGDAQQVGQGDPSVQHPWNEREPLSEALRPWQALPAPPVLPCLPVPAKGLARGLGNTQKEK